MIFSPSEVMTFIGLIQLANLFLVMVTMSFHFSALQLLTVITSSTQVQLLSLVIAIGSVNVSEVFEL
jgi:hypothetical protein